MRPYPYLRLEPEKKKRNTMAILIIVVMVMSVAGFFIGSSQGEVERFHGYKFIRENQLVQGKIAGKTYLFTYFPSELAKFPTDPKIKAALDTTPMVVVAYPQDALEANILAAHQYNIIEVFGIKDPNQYVQPALTKNNSFGLPIFTCAQATASVPGIVFEKANETGLYHKENCIVAQYESEASIPIVRDLVLYTALGVLP